MQKSETLKEISKAIISVMKEIKGIEKNLNVGTGNASYKGVSDYDVKKEIGRAMEKNGLCFIPINVDATLQIDRWEETGGQYGPKQKQQVFTSVKTNYMLLHESGEFIEVSGYGHGVDSQDKAAGKATTYALKYAMLYTFMVPTGKIDDADAVHSDEMPAPKAKQATAYNHKPIGNGKPVIPNERFKKAIDLIKKGDLSVIAELEKFALDETQKSLLEQHKSNLIPA